MSRLKLLVLFGGVSEEHGVSVKSAREVSLCLDKGKYEAVYVLVGQDGRWRPVDAPGAKPPQGVFAALLPGREGGGLVLGGSGPWRRLGIDVAFPVIHGKYGEDGTVQGALEAAGIPYVGCGIGASALCMDKSLTYLAVEAAGVAVPRHRVLWDDGEITAGDLTYPLFVKPARSGSSFGVSRVETPAALEAAVREARRYDRKVLAEEAVTGREIGCAVLGDGKSLVTGALDEVALSGGFFRVHQEAAPEKGSENATFHVPAPISQKEAAHVRETAVAIYRALGCRGLGRVDMFLTPEGRVVLNEVNTMPGFTSYSRYPRMMAGAGLSLGKVIDRLVGLAMEAFRERKGE